MDDISRQQSTIYYATNQKNAHRSRSDFTGVSLLGFPSEFNDIASSLQLESDGLARMKTPKHYVVHESAFLKEIMKKSTAQALSKNEQGGIADLLSPRDAHAPLSLDDDDEEEINLDSSSSIDLSGMEMDAFPSEGWFKQKVRGKSAAKLRSISVARNNIRLLPSSLWNTFPDIGILNCEQNDIQRIDVEGIQEKNGTRLRALNLSQNSLERSAFKAIGAMRNLNLLFLDKTPRVCFQFSLYPSLLLLDRCIYT